MAEFCHAVRGDVLYPIGGPVNVHHQAVDGDEFFSHLVLWIFSLMLRMMYHTVDSDVLPRNLFWMLYLRSITVCRV